MNYDDLSIYEIAHVLSKANWENLFYLEKHGQPELIFLDIQAVKKGQIILSIQEGGIK